MFLGRYVVRYQWDGETLTLTDPAGGVQVIRFQAHGLVQRRLSNGSQETSQYDGLGRCLFKHAKRANGETWARRYEWSGEGELRKSSDTVRGDVEYDYDAAHRLCGRTVDGRAEQFIQDDADNLLQQPGLEQATLIEGNRLASADGEEFLYNDRNNIGSRHGANRVTRYVYDSRDQLVRADTPGGVWEARYDARGRRTGRTWNGKSTEYYWNGDQLIAEVDHTEKLRLYIYADSLALSPLVILDYASLGAPPSQAGGCSCSLIRSARPACSRTTRARRRGERTSRRSDPRSCAPKRTSTSIWVSPVTIEMPRWGCITTAFATTTRVSAGTCRAIRGESPAGTTCTHTGQIP